MAAVGLLVAAGFGAAALWAVVGPRGLGPGGGPVVVVLGGGLGIAVMSAVRFAGLAAGLPPTAAMAAEVALLAAAVAAAVRRGGGVRGPVAEPSADPFRVGRVLLAVAVAAQAAHTARTFGRAADRIPHGMWDAFGFWNLRARVLAVPGDGWRRAFTDDIPHADYPLLLPLTVVRGWEWAGSFADAAGFAVSVGFVGLTAGLLFALLRALRGTSAGLLAVAVYLSADLVHLWGRPSTPTCRSGSTTWPRSGAWPWRPTGRAGPGRRWRPSGWP